MLRYLVSTFLVQNISGSFIEVSSVECNFRDTTKININDQTDWFSSWHDVDGKSFRGVMTHTDCPGGKKVFEGEDLKVEQDGADWSVTFNGYACDGADRESLSDYNKDNVAFVIQRIQDHPFVDGEVMRMGSKSMEFTCKIKEQDELEVVIGTVSDQPVNVGSDTFETAFTLIQTDTATGENNIGEDDIFSMGEQLFFKASGTDVEGLVYMPTAITVEKDGCQVAECRWTFYNVLDNNDSDKEDCQFPGLDFSVDQLTSGLMIQFKAFTLADQHASNQDTYKYKIKVTMNYCVEGQPDSACSRVQNICDLQNATPDSQDCEVEDCERCLDGESDSCAKCAPGFVRAYIGGGRIGCEVDIPFNG